MLSDGHASAEVALCGPSTDKLERHAVPVSPHDESAPSIEVMHSTPSLVHDEEDTEGSTGDGGIEADVELEADAENISSSESSVDSQEGSADIEYFRFSRHGLSARVEIGAETSLPRKESEPVGSPGDNTEFAGRHLPVIVDFEALCRSNCSGDDAVGSMVPRYAAGEQVDRHGETTSASGEPPVRHRGQGPVGSDDRLSAVIADILHRLNRQGVLADPRSVCKRGAKAGDFYELDDDFFDDSEAFDRLGFETDDFDEEHSEEESSRHSDFVQCEYVEASFFKFDNIINDDDEPLFTELHEGSEIPESSAPGSTPDVSATSSISDSDRQQYVTTTHWVRPSRWRGMREGLPSFVVEELEVLEEKLRPSGNRQGLFVEPAVVRALVQGSVRVMFENAYPTVPWSSYVAAAPFALCAAATGPAPSFVGNSVASEANAVADSGRTQSRRASPDGLVESGQTGGASAPVGHLVECVDLCSSPVLADGEGASTSEVGVPGDLRSREGSPPPEVQLCSGGAEARCAQTAGPTVGTISSAAPQPQSEGLNGLCSTRLMSCTPIDGQLEACTADEQLGEDQQSPKPLGEVLTTMPSNKRAPRPKKQKIFGPADVVAIHGWPHIERLTDCLTKMTSAVKREHVHGWWTCRLVLHNQIIYTIMEERLCDYVVKKLGMFRKAKSRFFRDLKSAVSEYLEKLARSALPKSATQAPHEKAAADPPESPDATKSLFFVVAAELVNWAVLYNCRKNELKAVGEPLEEWSASAAGYLSEKFNRCITRRCSSDPAKIDKKDRVWIPVKYMEDTLKQFRQYFGLVTLHERRSRRSAVPSFVLPCKGLGFPPPRTKAALPALKDFIPEGFDPTDRKAQDPRQTTPPEKPPERSPEKVLSGSAVLPTAAGPKKRRRREALTGSVPRSIKAKKRKQTPETFDMATALATDFASIVAEASSEIQPASSVGDPVQRSSQFSSEIQALSVHSQQQTSLPTETPDEPTPEDRADSEDVEEVLPPGPSVPPAEQRRTDKNAFSGSLGVHLSMQPSMSSRGIPFLTPPSLEVPSNAPFMATMPPPPPCMPGLGALIEQLLSPRQVLPARPQAPPSQSRLSSSSAASDGSAGSSSASIESRSGVQVVLSAESPSNSRMTPATACISPHSFQAFRQGSPVYSPSRVPFGQFFVSPPSSAAPRTAPLFQASLQQLLCRGALYPVVGCPINVGNAARASPLRSSVDSHTKSPDAANSKGPSNT